MLLRKLSGVGIAIAMAWAGTGDTPPTPIRSWSTATPSRNAARLTAKKRIAWKPACPSEPKVQRRFHRKLLVTAKTNAMVAAMRWWMWRPSTHRAKTLTFTA